MNHILFFCNLRTYTQTRKQVSATGPMIRRRRLCEWIYEYAYTDTYILVMTTLYLIHIARHTTESTHDGHWHIVILTRPTCGGPTPKKEKPKDTRTKKNHLCT